MAVVRQKHPHERFESLFRRFKTLVEKEDLARELRSREFYEKPSAKRKRKRAAAIKRQERETFEQKRQFTSVRQG